MQNIYRNHIKPPIKPVRNERTQIPKKPQEEGKTSFGDFLLEAQSLKERSGEIEFSKHAQDRLRERNISLTDNQIERVEEGVLEANEKGIKESLVLVDEVALVVNVKNQVVITAMEEKEQRVFTNIDGAIIV